MVCQSIVCSYVCNSDATIRPNIIKWLDIGWNCIQFTDQSLVNDFQFKLQKLFYWNTIHSLSHIGSHLKLTHCNFICWFSVYRLVHCGQRPFVKRQQRKFSFALVYMWWRVVMISNIDWNVWLIYIASNFNINKKLIFFLSLITNMFTLKTLKRRYIYNVRGKISISF